MEVATDAAQMETGRNNYRLQFRATTDGRTVFGGPVPSTYPELARCQTRVAALRNGLPGEQFWTVPVVEEPIFAGKDRRISGVRMSIELDGRRTEREFSVNDLFEVAAQMQLKTLSEQDGAFASNDRFVFNVMAEPEIAGGGTSAGDGVVARVESKPPPLFSGQIDQLLEKGEPCGPVDDVRDHPFFFPQKVMDATRGFLSKGGRKESGVYVFGHLYQQLSPMPELFGVAAGAVELRHADQETFSFQPTARTFADLEAQMQLRRTRLGRAYEVGLVMAHNHSFEPSVRDDGEANCTTCPLQQTCELTSSFYSTSDVAFHLGTFGTSQPWLAGMVVGLTPRREEDIRLFCFEGSRVRQRGYYVIP